MLILRRKEGQWLDVEHAASGDKLRICVKNIREPGQLDLMFEDDQRNFEINRPKAVPNNTTP